MLSFLGMRNARKLARELESFRAAGDVGTWSIGGLSIEYLYQKKSPQTLVFIHGNSAGKEVFYQQTSSLSNTNYSVLTVDLPGHGGSGDSKKPFDDYTFPSLALLLKQLLASLNIERPLIVGWSLGGHIAIEMAGRGFDLSGLMLFGTPPMGPGMEHFQQAFLPSDAMDVTVNPTPSEDDIRIYVEALYGTLSEIPPTFYKLAKRADGHCRQSIAAHWGSGDYGCHQRTVVAGCDKPICIVHGEADLFVSGQYMDGISKSQLWRGNIIRFPGIGHAPFLETPEQFNETLSTFAEHTFAQLS